MTEHATKHTWETRLARRMSSSSVARVALPRFTPCVLDMLDQARPQAHLATSSIT